MACNGNFLLLSTVFFEVEASKLQKLNDALSKIGWVLCVNKKMWTKTDKIHSSIKIADDLERAVDTVFPDGSMVISKDYQFYAEMGYPVVTLGVGTVY